MFTENDNIENDDIENERIDAAFNPAFRTWLNERDYTMLDWYNACTSIALVDEAEAAFGVLNEYGHPVN